MANENEVQVDLLASDQGISSEILKIADAMKQMLSASSETESSWRRLSSLIATGSSDLQKLSKDLAAYKKAGQTDLVAETKNSIKNLTAELADATRQINEARRNFQVSSEARAQGQERLLSSPLGGDGRTLGDAQTRNKAVGLITTALNTDDAQMIARIADAAAKAAERLVKTAEASLIARFNQVGISEQIRRETYGNIPTAQALLTRARISNEKVVQDYGPGTPQTLAERIAAKNAETSQKAADRRQVAEDRSTANYEISEAKNLDRKRTAQIKAEERAASVAERRAASEDRLNALYEISEAKNIDRKKTVSERTAERRAIAEERSTALYERSEAKSLDNKKTREDAALKRLDDDVRKAAEATRVANEKRIATNTYAEAQGEAGVRSGATAEKQFRTESTFQRRYGISQSEFSARVAAENLGLEEQRVLYAGLASDQTKLNAARRGAPPPRKIELTDEEKAARRKERQQSNNEALEDRLSENGGATFFGFQARIAANYAIFGAAVQAVRSVSSAILEYDDVLKQFQAITETTNTEMDKFRGQLLGIASDSKFSVNEIAKVAITLGQTGLSASEVAKALKPVIDLATASGSTLSQSVETVTAVLGAYALEAARAGDVSDVFVGALNRTKLTMDQLQLGIQYAANIARDSGVSFSELTATIGSIAQAGVKSGSTIGTGTRQLLTELSSPTEKFRNVLKELGISLADVDLKTNGLTGVLENLRNKGFTTADALRSLDLRAAAAFSALAGQGNRAKLLQQELLLTSAAAEASTRANESLSAGFQRLQNSAFSVVDKAFLPMIEALKGATGGVASLFQGLSSLGPILPIIGTGIASLAAAAAALKVGALVQGLLTAATIPLPVLGVAGALTAIVGGGALISYLDLLDSKSDAASKRLDQLKASENDIIGRGSSIDTNTNSINNTILQLIDRREKLNSDPILRQTAVIEAQKAFSDIGLEISSSTKNIDELVEALQRLRGGLAQQAPGLLLEQLRLVREETKQLITIRDEEAKKNRIRTVIDDPRGGTIRRSDSLEKFSSLEGSGFDLARSIIRDPSQLGSDALGGAGPARTAISDAIGAGLLAKARAQEINDQKEVDKQQRRLDLLEELNKLLSDNVGRQSNINAKEKRIEDLTNQSQAKTISQRADVLAFDASAESIYAQRNRDKIRITGDNTLDPLGKREAIGQSLEVAKQTANIQSSFLEDLAKELQAGGYSKEVVDQALGPIRNRLADLGKGVSEELRQIIDGYGTAAKSILAKENRGLQLQIDNALKSAGVANNPGQISAAEDQIKAAVQSQMEIQDKIAKLSVTNPEEVENNSDVVRIREEGKENLRISMEGFAQKILEARKRLAQQLLDYRDEADAAEKAKRDKQIETLRKVLTDANTTPQKMAEVVAALNKLLDESAEIAKKRNQTELERSLVRAPSEASAVIPSAAAPEGSQAKAIVDAANAAGSDAGMTRYILALAQLESALNTNTETTKSTAKGALQFIDSTFKKFGTGDVKNLNDNIAAGVEYTKYLDKTFKQQFYRDPTNEERFVLHNQGEGGGPALFKADPNARAADIVGARAVTNQNASVDLTVAQFLEFLKNKFRTAFDQTSGQTKTVRQTLIDKKDAQDATVDENRRKEDDKTRREVEAAETRNKLSLLKGLDREAATRLEGEASLVRRAVNPQDAAEANRVAIATIAELRNNAVEKDRLGNANRDGPARKEDEANINDAFRNKAETQAISAADAIGKLKLKAYDDQIDQIKNEIKDLDRDSSSAKFDSQHYNSLKQQLEVLEKQKDLRGQVEAYDAQINSLNESLNDIQSKGLGDRTQLLKITEQISALEAKRKALLPSVERSDKLDSTQANFGQAFDQGVDDFQKSRGIKNNLGQLVDATQLARKQISTALSTISGAFDNLFVNIFNGSLKAGDALKKFAQEILSGLLSQATKALTNSLFSAAFSGFGGGGGGGISSFLFGGGGFGGAANGGMPAATPGMAGGGIVTGGVPNRDSVPRRLMPGEFVLRKSAVQGVGRENLEAINAMGNSVRSQSARVPQMPSISAQARSNIYIVPPDFPRQPGPNDFIHAIGSDIQTNGKTAKLIKQVVAGHI